MKRSASVTFPCVGLLTLALSLFGITLPVQPASFDHQKPSEYTPEEAAANDLYWDVHRDFACWFLYPDRLTRLKIPFVTLRNINDAEAVVNSDLALLGDEWSRYESPTQAAISKATWETGNTVFTKTYDGNVGYIRIAKFNQPTAGEVAKALDVLPPNIPLIIDLRGNRGGMTRVAFRVFSLFVDDGVFAEIGGFDVGKWQEQELRVEQKLIVEQNHHFLTEERFPNKLGKRKVVVLIDGKTASAAEMLTLALRDNGVATTIGTTSFGKGVGQSIFQLRNGGQLTVTTCCVYSPKHESIHKRGITPERIIQNISGSDDQFIAACELLRGKTPAIPIVATK